VTGVQSVLFRSVGPYADGTKAVGSFTDFTSGSQKDFGTKDPVPTTDVVTITKYDATAKKISGTFNFTVTDDDNANDKKVFTNGTFTDITW
jgi:hypothetical protein